MRIRCEGLFGASAPPDGGALINGDAIGHAAGDAKPPGLRGSDFSGVVTNQSRMNLIRASLVRIATSDVPVLLRGESGVGKEVLARQLHAASIRSEKPFLKLNCAALPSELLESEMFGYERGAFTGAYKSTPGLLEMGDKGTLLLDEIGDMDVRLQAKLLHVLQDHEFQRVGGRKTIQVDVRLMAATHRDLSQAIRDGSFREDLYYRLKVIQIEIPPLRERKEEIAAFARHFLTKHATPMSETVELTPRLERALMEYDWPGNIRELENAMQRLLVLQDPEDLIRELTTAPMKHVNGWRSEAGAAPRALAAVAGEFSVFEQADRTRDDIEKQAIRAALSSSGWNRKKAADLLGVKYKALLYRMRKLGIGEEEG
jgi:transcriptional regulator with PAS, ATPase and Fis domain